MSLAVPVFARFFRGCLRAIHAEKRKGFERQTVSNDDESSDDPDAREWRPTKRFRSRPRIAATLAVAAGQTPLHSSRVLKKFSQRRVVRARGVYRRTNHPWAGTLNNRAWGKALVRMAASACAEQSITTLLPTGDARKCPAALRFMISRAAAMSAQATWTRNGNGPVIFRSCIVSTPVQAPRARSVSTLCFEAAREVTSQEL